MLTDKEISEIAQDLKDFADVNDLPMVLKAAQLLASLHYHYLLEKQEADQQAILVTKLSEELNCLKNAVNVYLSKKDATGSFLLLQEAVNCC